MPGITLKNGLISYYGNPAGYVVFDKPTEKEKAVVDTGFQNDELTAWLQNRALTPQWTDGVMERLIAGEQMSGTESAAPLKNVRIWQLSSDSNIRMKFIGLEEMCKEFGQPDPAHYRIAYDGQLGTNDLEAIYTRCNTDHPPGYNGHSLSMSDVVELYDGNGSNVGMGSEFYYCDRYDFKLIAFEPGEPEQGMTQGMNMSF